MKKASLILVACALAFGAFGCAVQTAGTDGTSGEPTTAGANASSGTSTASQSVPVSPRPHNHADDVFPKCISTQPHPWNCGIYETSALPGITTGDPATGAAGGPTTGTGAGTGTGTGSDQDENAPTTSVTKAGATGK